MKAQNKTNADIAARYAEEERRRREGKQADKALSEEIEARRQDRMRANRDEIDEARQFALNTNLDEEELRQGVRIQGGVQGEQDES